MVRSLWSAMDRGDFSPILEKKLLRFNGQLFADPNALPVTDTQLELLIDAAKADWKAVEPAIFGTLLERLLTQSNATSSVPTTHQELMSNVSSSRPSSNRFAKNGRQFRPQR